MKTKGLLMINTGNGKGKTTAALGLALRTLGHDLPVCIIQFIKGSWKYGELKSMERFRDKLDYYVVGKGFTWETKNIEEDKKAARDGWEQAKKAITDDRYQLLILDELTYLLNYEMVDKTEVISMLKAKPENLHIMVTGRNAPPELVEIADLVTEMKEVRHPYKSGINGQRGIEW